MRFFVRTVAVLLLAGTAACGVDESCTTEKLPVLQVAGERADGTSVECIWRSLCEITRTAGRLTIRPCGAEPLVIENGHVFPGPVPACGQDITAAGSCTESDGETVCELGGVETEDRLTFTLRDETEEICAD